MFQNKNIKNLVLLELLKGERHLRGIAKNIETSPSTLMRTTNELVKNNVVDYKTEGKNKVFFIKNTLQAMSAVYEAEYYKFAKLLETYPELSIILGDVLSKSGAKFIILFGSFARFSADKKSDIDIYVEDISEKKIIENINSKINIKTGKFNLNSELVREIIKNHVVIKGVEEFYEKIGFFKKT